jgi:ABC-2 type transport system permease protein
MFAEAWGTRLFDKHMTALRDAYDRQNSRYRLGAFGVPLIGLQSLSMAMAGTDHAHVRHFADAAERYRRQVMRILNDDIALNDFPENRRLTGQRPGEREYWAGRALWATVPPFIYDPPTAGGALREQWPAIAALAVWLAAVLMAVPLSLARLSVD